MRTRRLWWRPMVLNVSVGQSVVHRADVAVGHQTQLDERLEAVADAQHQTVAVLQQVAHRLGDGSGARKNAVMNLAEPSGSSPPEKPPGIMTIWLFAMRVASACACSRRPRRASGC